MPCRQDEEVRLGDRVDVADRDEPVGGVHVVALGDEPAEQAVSGGDGKDPLLGDADGARTQRSADLGASTSHGV